MGPKGIGPQRLGAGMSSQKSTCCGIPNCGCSGSPNKLLGAAAGMVGKALIGKAVDKLASPNKKKNCSY